MMYRIVFVILCSFGIQLNVLAQSYTIPEEVKRIIFLGNSITYQGKYIEFIDAYYSIAHPNKKLEIINVGLPSETVSGLSEPNHANGRFPRPALQERLERVLALTQPDLVFTCYGMNDGIYLPFSEERFDQYKKGMYWLHEALENAGAEIIHLTPPVYDPRKGEAYANVLDIYADWLVSQRYTNEWNVIDIHRSMNIKLEMHRLVDSTFVFAKDGIHPNEAGHFVMAEHILSYLGESALEESIDMDHFLSAYSQGTEIFTLVQKRQQLSKDAWLTSIGHERPNMNEGISLEVLQRELEEIEGKIRELLSKE